MLHPTWLIPEWPVAGVGALMTTRQGGVSAAPFDTMNLGATAGDDPAHVITNRKMLAQASGVQPVFLNQVHGADVVQIGRADAGPGAALLTADASCTTQPGIACTVLVADCLPVLFAAPQGRAVAAAHAGWRGLASGVLQSTLAAVCEAAQCQPAEVRVWMGACIGPRRFEVGQDVIDAFRDAGAQTGAMRFVPHGSAKWLANLSLLARDALQAAGVIGFGGGRWCSVSDRSRFFSFRRDGSTGRMAAAVWIEPRRD